MIMDSIVLDGCGEFVYPAERIVGRIAALHRDEFEVHDTGVQQAKADCAEWNRKYFPVVPKRITSSKSKNKL
jgi:hypothetical protein